MLLELPKPGRGGRGWLRRAAWWAGLGEVVRGEGVRYVPQSGRLLLDVLAARGEAEYEARFDGAASMRVRCSVDRPYADLLGPCALAAYLPAESLVRPGDRVLDARCWTGAGSAWLSALAGPSGSVLATQEDHESIRFARRRYGLLPIAFEHGGLAALGGELDGAFDVVVAVGALAGASAPERTLSELWRVVRPGGLLYVAEGGPRSLRPSASAPGLRAWVAQALRLEGATEPEHGEEVLALCAVRKRDAGGEAVPRLDR